MLAGRTLGRRAALGRVRQRPGVQDGDGPAHAGGGCGLLRLVLLLLVGVVLLPRLHVLRLLCPVLRVVRRVLLLLLRLRLGLLRLHVLVLLGGLGVVRRPGRLRGHEVEALHLGWIRTEHLRWVAVRIGHAWKVVGPLLLVLHKQTV